jgi:hypothetical protein
MASVAPIMVFDSENEVSTFSVTNVFSDKMGLYILFAYLIKRIHRW